MSSTSWAKSTLMATTFLALVSTTLLADPPNSSRLFRKKEPANPKSESLMLSPENGPWLIRAYVFDGESAESRAIELCKELRSTYGLKAYIFPKSFDYSEKVQGSGFDSNGKQKRMVYADSRSIECYAVLIGDFTSAESPNYIEQLKVVKFANPKALGGDGSNPGASMKESWSELKKLVMMKSNESKVKPGPMLRAFGTSNPALPRDFMQPPVVDKFVKGLNAQCEYSLLENPKRFTVRIATFRGQDSVVIGNAKPSVIDESELTGLDRAAEAANTAVQLLRSQGVEAYQFHDRTSSIVAVGGFDSIGQTNSDGSFSYAPEIQKVIATYGGVKDVKASQYGQVPTARTLLDVIHYKKIPELNRGTEKEKMQYVKKYSIPLELTPTVMAIPRPEAKSIYSGSLLGKH